MKFEDKMKEQTKRIVEFWKKHTEFTLDEAAGIWIIQNAEKFAEESA